MCKVLNVIAMIFVFIGGLNWGLGVFNFNLVTALFGVGLFTKIIYALVGLSALYLIIWSLIGHCACGCKCNCEETPKAKKRK